MNLNYKIIFIIFVIFFLSAPLSAKVNENEESLRGMKGYETQTLDAAKNARQHCNMGNIYFDEKNYLAALKEYEIAYNLTYDKNISASYLYNIARCYIMVNNYELALNAIKGAINKDCINITYYNTLVDCYINLKITDKMLQKHIDDTENPYGRIIAGLIYLKTGQTISAKIIFDEFINDHPKMIISDDVRAILRKL